jgi:hypothetical protein
MIPRAGYGPTPDALLAFLSDADYPLPRGCPRWTGHVVKWNGIDDRVAGVCLR